MAQAQRFESTWTGSGWAWERHFLVRTEIGELVPAVGEASFYWGVPGPDDTLVISEDQSVNVTLDQGRVSFELPLVPEISMGILIVRTDGQAEHQFAPYCSTFELWPLAPPPVGQTGGVVLEASGPTILHELKDAVWDNGSIMVADNIGLLDTAFNAFDPSVRYAPVPLETAAFFATPKKRLRTAAEFEIGGGSAGGSPTHVGSIGTKPIGGYYLDTNVSLLSPVISFPKVLRPAAGGMEPLDYMLLDASTGSFLASGRAQGAIAPIFPHPVSGMFLIFYAPSVTASTSLAASALPECASVEDESLQGFCDITDSGCFLLTQQIAPSNCVEDPNGSNGTYEPHSPGGGGSITETAWVSDTTTITQSTENTTSTKITVSTGTPVYAPISSELAVAKEKKFTRKKSNSISQEHGVSIAIAYEPGETAALQWSEKRCCYECVTETINFAPYGGLWPATIDYYCVTYETPVKEVKVHCDEFFHTEKTFDQRPKTCP